MKKIFITLIIGTAFLLPCHRANCQDILNATAKMDTTQASVRTIIDRLKSIESIHLSYNEKNLDLDKIIYLPAGTVTVQELLDLVSDKLGLEYQFHGKQIILKSKSAYKYGESRNYTISGYIKDKATGESLLGATVQLKGTTIGATTNLYGYYSLTFPKGDVTLVYSYMGYQKEERSIDLNDNITLTIELAEETSQLKEVVITGQKPDDNVAVNQMSYNKIEARTIEQIPALFGEIDPLKVIRLLPGVSMTSETSSSFSVRGGGHDQNLILLDEAVVYNPSHLIGIFSTFNNDAIKSMEFYKGNMPTRYGGRLSSLLDVRMKEGNNKKLSGQGGISPIASRITLEVPLIKEKSSMVLSGRRTYMDVFTKLNEETKDAILHFYDFNAKINYNLNERNQLFISSYWGRDAFGIDTDDFNTKFAWGNFTGTMRWNRLYNQKLFSNLSLIYSNYNYNLGLGANDMKIDWGARMNDYTLKIDYDYFLSPQHTLYFGASSSLHVFNPGEMKLKYGSSSNTIKSLFSRALEHGIYISMDNQFADGRLLISPGLRLSALQNLGSYTLYDFDEQGEVIHTTNYESGDIFNTFAHLEPRLAMTYRITDAMSIKTGYARSIQYLHLASNSVAGTPLDVWVPATPNVKPQKSDQYTFGIFQNFLNNKLETSVEVYYKEMIGQIDFKDHANLMLNKYMEAEFRAGLGKSYGIEMLIRKPEGKLNGWISYTYSNSTRRIKGVNDGSEYLSPHDRPHNLSVVGNYKLSNRLSISANWVYFSGAPVTAPEGKYYYNNSWIPAYSERNGDRLPDYMRIDLAVNLSGKKKPGKWFYSDWSLSVYNLTNRKNAAFVQFREKENDASATEAVKWTLLPIIPTIAWNFHF